jgi:RHS repeat-associated protein
MKTSYHLNLSRGLKTLSLAVAILSVFCFQGALAAPTNINYSVGKSAIETVGTKSDKLMTQGKSGVDESTGAFTYTYTVDLPNARGGIQPDLTLTYNSQHTQSGIFGAGWMTSLPYIERGNKYGIDKMYTQPTFVSSVAGELTTTDNITYVAKVDNGEFQEYTYKNGYFTMKDRDGTLYTFGDVVNSKVSDSTNTKTGKWYLTEVKDTNGNYVIYSYTKYNGQAYLTSINYTNQNGGGGIHTVYFDLEDRPDSISSYGYGFLVETKKRVKTIRINELGAEIANVNLVYTSGSNGVKSLLSSVSESRKGTDEQWTTIPATLFQYENSVYGYTASSTEMLSSQSPNTTYIDLNGDGRGEQFTDANYINDKTEAVDVNGDYKVDFIENSKSPTYISNVYTTNYFIAQNNGTGTVTKVNTPALSTPITSLQPNGAPGFMPEHKWVVSADINGDGLTDFANSGWMGQGVNFHNGKDWGTKQSNWNTGDIYTKYEDMNGDGLADKIVQDTSAASATSTRGLHVYLNNGSGWNSQEEVSYRYSTPFIQKTYDQYNYQTGQFDLGVRLVDINADGLTDIIRSYYLLQNNGWTPGFAPTGDIREVFLNTGSSLVQASSTALLPTVVSNNWFDYGYNAYKSNAAAMYDKNGDGITDIGGVLNIAKRQDILKKVILPTGGALEVSYRGSAELAPTNTVSTSPKLPVSMQVVTKVLSKNTAGNPDEEINYVYEGGEMYFDANNVRDRKFAGFKKVTKQKGAALVTSEFYQGNSDDTLSGEVGDNYYLIGKPYKVTEGNTNGAKTKETLFRHKSYTLNGLTFVYPKEIINLEYGTSTTRRSQAENYEYDLGSRLILKSTNFGEVNYDIFSSTWTDVGTDLITRSYIYTDQRPQKVSEEKVVDIDNNLVSKKQNFYDNLPYGKVGKGLLTKTLTWVNSTLTHQENFVWNSFGLLLQKTETGKGGVSFTYDSTNLYPTESINSLGHKTILEYQKSTGTLVRSVSPNNFEEKTTFDGFGRAIKTESTNEYGNLLTNSTYSYTYSAPGFSQIVTRYTGGSPYNTESTYFDGLGRKVQTKKEVGNNTYRTTVVSYNTDGSVAYITYPYQSSNSLYGDIQTTGKKEEYVYDTFGRLIEKKQGDVSEYTSYDVGRVRTWNNSPLVNAKSLFSDVFGRLVQVNEENATSTYSTKYQRDVMGNLIRLEDTLGNIRNFKYDLAGNLIEAEDIHAKNDTTFGNYQYTYNSFGGVTSKTYPGGVTDTYTYDSLGRLLTDVSDTTTAYSYDICQYGIGKVCNVTRDGGSTAYSYNRRGLTHQEIVTIDGATYSSVYDYDDLKRLNRVILPDQNKISYEYTKDDKQSKVTYKELSQNVAGAEVETPIINDTQFNIDGTESARIFGNYTKDCRVYADGSGTHWSGLGMSPLYINSFPRLSDIYVLAPSGSCNTASIGGVDTMFHQDVRFDKAGNVALTRDYRNGSFLTRTFAYDPLARLILNTETVGSSATTTESFIYNEIGSLLKSGNTNYTYEQAGIQNSHAPSIVGGKRLSYDARGNLLNDTQNDYTYTNRNKQKKIVNQKGEIEYLYDEKGERLAEKFNLFENIGGGSTATTTATSTFSNLFEESFTKDNAISQYFVTLASKNELASIGATTTAKVVETILPIFTSPFVTESCSGVLFSERGACQKDQSLSALFAVTLKEKAVTLTRQTLQEAWHVFRGELAIPSDNTPYATTTPNILISQRQDSANSELYYSNNSANTYKVMWTNTCALHTYIEASSTRERTCIYNPGLPTSVPNKNTGYTLSNASLSAFVYSGDMPLEAQEVIAPINLATTTQTVSPVVIATSTKNTTTNSYVFNITNLVKSWYNGNQKNGISISHVATTSTSTMVTNLYSNDSWYVSTSQQPVLDLSFAYTGAIYPNTLATSTLHTATEVDDIYDDFTQGIPRVIKTYPIDSVYISETANNELSLAGMRTLDDVKTFINWGKNASTTISRCGSTESCIKNETLKAVYLYVQSKRAVTLTKETLEEVWRVSIGTLKMPFASSVYTDKLVTNLSKHNLDMSNCTNYFNWSQDPAENCNFYTKSNSYYTLPTQFYNATGTTRVLIESTYKNDPYYITILPIKIVRTAIGNYVNPINNEWSSVYEIRQPIAQINPLVVGKTEVTDITDAVNKYKNQNNLTQVIQIMADGPYINQITARTLIDKAELKLTRFDPKYSIQSRSSITSSLVLGGDTEVQNLVNSLPNNPAAINGKLIAKESFADISSINITQSDILSIGSSLEGTLNPYSSCQSLSSIEAINCKKVNFIKYFYAYILDQKGKALSVATLEDIYEVYRGNLFVPYSVADYVTVVTKTDNITPTTIRTDVTNGNQMFNECNVGTPLSYFYAYGYNTMKCGFLFALPTAVSSEVDNITAATIELKNTSLGNSNNINNQFVFERSPNVIVGNIISSGTNQYTGKAEFVYGTTTSTTSSTIFQNNDRIDILNTLKKWAKNQITSVGLYLGTNEYIALTSDGTGYQMPYTTFANNYFKVNVERTYDNPQIIRASTTPIQITLSDAAITSSVHNLYASSTQANYGKFTIVSPQTWAELASTTIRTNVDVKNLFSGLSASDKLPQLYAIQTQFANASTTLSRAALEELYLVNTGVLDMPQTVDQYNFATTTTVTDRFASSTWSILSDHWTGSINGINQVVKDTTTCRVTYNVNAFYGCYIKNTFTAKPYLNVVDAKLTLATSTKYWIAPSRTDVASSTIPMTVFDEFKQTAIDTANKVLPLTEYMRVVNTSTVPHFGFTLFPIGTENGNNYNYMYTSNVFASTDATSTLPVLETTYKPLYNILNRTQLGTLDPLTASSTGNGVTGYTADLNLLLTGTTTIATLATTTATSTPNYSPLKGLLNGIQSFFVHYPNRFLQVDSRGVKTVKIPLNGVDIAEVRYESGVIPHKELTYLHNNYQGSPVLTTNETGQILQNNWYDVWGTRIATSTATTTIQSREGYTGHITDEETGLTYAHARYLSTDRKIFLSEDPRFWTNFDSPEFLTDPQAQNSYSYVKNNPVTYVDPTGEWWKEVTLDKINPWVQGQSVSDFQIEVGQASQTMYNDNSAWNYAFDNPIKTGAMVGVGSGAVVVGASYLSGAGYVSSSLANGQLISNEAVKAIQVRNTLLNNSTNPKLVETVNQMFKPSDKIAGGTIEALKRQVQTGRLTGGKDHLIKGEQLINRMNNIQKTQQLSTIEQKGIQTLSNMLKKLVSGIKK